MATIRRFVPFVFALALLAASVSPAVSQEVIVIGSIEGLITWLESENWWGETRHGQQLVAPHVIVTGISPAWNEAAGTIPVEQKKEIFYRLMLPLVLHANQMVMDRREKLKRGDEKLAAGGKLTPRELDDLRRGARLLRVGTESEIAALDRATPARLREIIAELLTRLDVIPPGLVLGQAAYESGYGTSRFAAEGNALFGQWTFGGEGLKPSRQRQALGDHRIAAFEWPFDSVRGYYLNLSSHPAYEDFRRLRAERRAAGKPLRSLDLADGLIRYSERGQTYVDTLKGIIRKNKLDVADDAVFRDEPLRFYVSTGGPDEVALYEAEIEKMRASGEVDRIIERMRLD